MVRSLAAAVGLLSVVACASPGGGGVAAPPAAPPTPATPAALEPFFGSYRLDGGGFLVIARLGWFFDSRDGTYRTIYAGKMPNRFSIGPGFRIPLPTFGDLIFASGMLSVRARGRTAVGRRLAYRQTDVTFAAEGARLAGTVTEALGAGPHPAIVVVHGSEPGQRYFYDFWVGLYASIGLTVLTYDKRGQGASTGVYPGESPTDQTLQVLAGDASAALRFLAAWPGVDAARVGFHGGSQGGWTVPLAMMRHPHAAFAVLASAPATTTGQTDLWKGFSGGGAFLPTESTARMDAAVRADHSGYDPGPALAALSVPTLWLLGSSDRTVPTAICAEVLAGLHKPNLTVRTLPTGHGLLVNRTGLDADDDRSTGLPADLLPAIAAWMRAATA